jgi:WD40 repeat protein
MKRLGCRSGACVVVSALSVWVVVCVVGAASAWAAPLVLTRVGSFGTGGGDASAVAFSPTGRLLAAPNYNVAGPLGTLSVFSVGSTGTLMPVPGSPPLSMGGLASSVAFSPDGRLLVTADGTLSVFAVGSGGQLTRVPGSPVLGDSAAFSPGGGLLAVTGGGGVDVFSVGSGGQLTRVPGSPFSIGSPTGVASVAFSPNGRLLATASPANPGRTGECGSHPPCYPTRPVPGRVSMFSVGSGGHLTRVGSSFVDGDGPVSVAFSPGGSLVAAANSGSVSVLSAGSNGELTEVHGSPFQTGNAGAGSLAFSRDGRLLASYDGTLSVFSVGPHGRLTQVLGSPHTSGNLTNTSGAVAFSPGGGLLATADVFANTVSVFSVAPPPVPVVLRLSIRPRAFRAATHGTTLTNGTHVGALISYRDSMASLASFTVYRAHSQVSCSTPRRQRCKRLVIAGSFSRRDRAGTDTFRFSGRLRNSLPPGSYLLKLVASFDGGSNSRPVTARFTILPQQPSNRPG